jgi:hypothetical protein
LDIAQEIIKKQAEQYRQLLESNREIMAIRHDYNNITTDLGFARSELRFTPA